MPDQPGTPDTAHMVLRHTNGDQCVWLDDHWFVPLDVGGEGHPCPHDHPATQPSSQPSTQVWLTYTEPSMAGHRGIYATLDLAQRSCEVKVEEWITTPPWDEEDEPHPQLHPIRWTREPDPGLPQVFHPNVPEDKYVWIGRYCDEQPTWYFKVAREPVAHA